MPSARFDTPEAAARDGFPPEHVRLVALAVEGEDGFYVLDTGPAGYRYLYAGAVYRDGEHWYSGSDGNAVGWLLTNQHTDLGTLALWDEAPPDAEAVRVRWRDEVRDVPVAHGVYLTVWWRKPCPDEEWPLLVAFRKGGQWVALPAQA